MLQTIYGETTKDQLVTVQTNDIGSKLFKAAKAHFESERDDALATLAIYFRNPVAIGDHPNFLEEIKSQISKLSSAEEAIESLEKNFSNFEKSILR
tara:strand:+ start:6117 stop:6404 length:288 start_codon:yes stop_codon:yes gene_type:complete